MFNHYHPQIFCFLKFIFWPFENSCFSLLIVFCDLKRTALLHFRTPFTTFCTYWWLIMKKYSWELYHSPNPNPKGGKESAIALKELLPFSWCYGKFYLPLAHVQYFLTQNLFSGGIDVFNYWCRWVGKVLDHLSGTPHAIMF